MDGMDLQWRITGDDSPSASFSAKAAGAPGQSVPTTPPAYKPSLTVDVAAAERGDASQSGMSPQTAQTPHVATNIFVAGLPIAWGDDDLRDHYKPFGDILSTRVVHNKHFGFVMFRTAEAAHNAINSSHLSRPTPTCPTLLHVSIAMHDEGVDDAPNDRIFVRGLPQWATKGHLRQTFAPFGEVVECAVLMNPLGQCKGSGFIQFRSTDEATAAVDARDRARIENWDQILEVKYSETLEVRQQRQERNRNRQRVWASSPKFRGPSVGGAGGGLSPGAGLPGGMQGGGGAAMSMNPPHMPFFAPQICVLPSPSQNFPMVSPMPFPMAYQQPSSNQTPIPPPPPMHAGSASNLGTPSMSQRPTQIIYPQPMTSPFYGQGNMMMMEPPLMPLKGDLHFSGQPVSEEVLRLLLQPFGSIDRLKNLDKSEGGGIAVRMANVSQHTIVAQSLNGTVFPNGEMLAAGLYA